MHNRAKEIYFFQKLHPRNFNTNENECWKFKCDRPRSNSSCAHFNLRTCSSRPNVAHVTNRETCIPPNRCSMIQIFHYYITKLLSCVSSRDVPSDVTLSEIAGFLFFCFYFLIGKYLYLLFCIFFSCCSNIPQKTRASVHES